jgi:hypothetical protein
LKIDVDGNELAVLKSGINLLNKFHPVLYFENDLRPESGPLLEFVLNLGYRIFFHAAPIFQPNNFYENPINIFEKNIFSMMMLAIPPGKMVPPNLREVLTSQDWWE